MDQNIEKQSADPMRSLLHAYADGELTDASSIEEIERRLRNEEAFREEFESIKALREALRSGPRPTAPSYLHNRVAAILDEAQEAPPDASVRSRSWTRWVGFAAAACLLLAIGLNLWPGFRQPDMAAMLVPFVEQHIAQSVSGGPRVELADPQQIEGWLGERLEFNTSVPRWEWADPVSAGIDYVDGHRVACVRYTTGGESFTLFARLPASGGMLEAAGATSPSSAMIDDVRGYRVACWAKDSLEYILVASPSNHNLFDQLKGVS